METTGLSREEVAARIEQNKTNRRVDSSTKTTDDIVKENVFTYFNLIFVILALLLCVVRSWRNLTFMVVIICNTLIGIIQEIHAKHELDRLSLLGEAKTKVLRDGVLMELVSEELVLDDVILLYAGNQIPADAVVLEGSASVNEALLTGEADEIAKQSGDELLSGSFLVSGQLTARLTKVGPESYINRLTMQATKSKDGEQSEMIRSLNRLIKVVGVILIPIGILLFVQSFFFNEGTLYDSITGMVAAVIGMIPEGLYLLASVAMAVSTMRLARDQVLVHDMKCIETLARVNVLCVDKTGTVTEPRMQVTEVVSLTGQPAEDGAEAARETGKAINEDGKRRLESLISDFAASMAADNATMEALKEYAKSGSGQRAAEVFGFSSAYKYSGAVFADGAYVLGAPEFVLRDAYVALRGRVEEFARQGKRVLVFGRYDGTLTGEALTAEVEPLGLVCLANPIREGAKETFAYFAEHDVEIKVISGDNPKTVSVIAKEAGIRGAESYVDAATLSTEQDYADAITRYTVFGRVTPEQKRKLVHALKKAGRTVAMTGDGVNDVLALKDADCSVAMASGADAASNVSQLVLMDSDFTRMPAVVMEGRRVVNNIERTASLYLVKNIFSMLLALFSVILVLDYPLEPAQVSLVAMFTIGTPSFFLALEPNKSRIQGHFLPNVLMRALPAGLTDFLIVAAFVVFCAEFNVPEEGISTACTILLSLVGFFVLYRVAKPMNLWHGLLVSAMVAGCVLSMVFISGFFGIHAMSRSCVMLLVIFAVCIEPLMRYFGIFFEWMHGRLFRKA